jgi:hypothetical protein
MLNNNKFKIYTSISMEVLLLVVVQMVLSTAQEVQEI